MFAYVRPVHAWVNLQHQLEMISGTSTPLQADKSDNPALSGNARSNGGGLSVASADSPTRGALCRHLSARARPGNAV